MATRDYLTVEKIGYQDSVYFTMEVYKENRDPFFVWRCHGYAMASGCKIADWDYYAISEDEAYSQETKDYLIRELKPLVAMQLKHLAHNAQQYLATH